MAGIPTIEPYAMPAPGELPENSVRWHVDASRAVLLIHDMQRYFVRPIPHEQPGVELVNNISMLRDQCVRRGIPIAYTMQPGDMAAEQRGLLADFWGPGMRTSPTDRKIVEPLAPGPGDWTFTKWRYSAFVRSDLLSRLREQDRDQLIICGVYAHVGVLATAVDAFSHDIQPFVVADAVGDFSAEQHQQTLRYAADCCARVLTAKEVLAP